MSDASSRDWEYTGVVDPWTYRSPGVRHHPHIYPLDNRTHARVLALRVRFVLEAMVFGWPVQLLQLPYLSRSISFTILLVLPTARS